MEPNELKLVKEILSELEKKIYLLRISLYGAKAKKDIEDSLATCYGMKQKGKEYKLEPEYLSEDYRMMIDCYEVEETLGRIIQELSDVNTYNTLKEAVRNYERTNTAFEKRQEILKSKRRQIEDMKALLPQIKKQNEAAIQSFKAADEDFHKKKKQKESGTFQEFTYMKKLMDSKIESKKKYFDYLLKEAIKKNEWYEKETRAQAHADIQIISFWLLKYDEYSEEVDSLLREMFDKWSEKEREIAVLNKYRKLNSRKIKKVSKMIALREDYLEKDRKEKEEEQRKRDEEIKINRAATIIQAFWRGTIVRRHLGPFKKKGKGKGKKEKGKKEKGKKKK